VSAGTAVATGDTLLRIYLNDHLAGATAGLALARRTLRSNPDGELGDFLRRLVTEIAEDRAALEQVLRELGLPRNPAKVQAARVLELAGRLKLNGRLRGYSDLSRVLELEGMTMGITGKLSLWETIEQTRPDAARRGGLDLAELQARARSQLDRLAPHRHAAMKAFL
jgi:hypothetical protein